LFTHRAPLPSRSSPSSSSTATVSNPARLDGPLYSGPPLPSPFPCPLSLSLSLALFAPVMADSSPIKQIKRLLSPSKQKPLPPPALHPTTHHPNESDRTYSSTTTTTSSTSTDDSSLNTTLSSGWNVVDTAPTFEDKENVHNGTGTKVILDQVMGSPKKLTKKPSKPKSLKATGTQDLDKEFEDLMVLPYLIVRDV